MVDSLAIDIALIQQGGTLPDGSACGFVVKARNAQAAGAEAVIIFNQGNNPSREPLIVGTLGDNPGVTIPVAQLTFAFSTESVNGVKGKPVPGKPIRLPAPAGPQGTFVTDGGHAEHDPAA